MASNFVSDRRVRLLSGVPLYLHINSEFSLLTDWLAPQTEKTIITILVFSRQFKWIDSVLRWRPPGCWFTVRVRQPRADFRPSSGVCGKLGFHFLWWHLAAEKRKKGQPREFLRGNHFRLKSTRNAIDSTLIGRNVTRSKPDGPLNGIQSLTMNYKWLPQKARSFSEVWFRHSDLALNVSLTVFEN